jgi:hypothetical protein
MNYFEQKDESLKLLSYHNSIIKNGSIWFNFKLIDSFLKELKKKDVRPIFIYMPTEVDYLKGEDPSITKNNFFILHYFENKYKAKIIDLQSGNGLKTSDFSDPVHLNYFGAKKISKIIAKELTEK